MRPGFAVSGDAPGDFGGLDPRARSRRSNRHAASTSAGAATNTRGWPWSRQVGASATVCWCWPRRSCAATTSPTLQDGLNQLGFDCGRPDGIFGPATVRALEDFQRNGGLSPDGICGPRTVRMLELLRRQTGSGPGVASVREALTIHESLRTLRIVVGQFGGLSSITRSVTRALRNGGATVMSTDEYEAAAQAAAANRFGAQLYVGFEARSDERSLISYFAVPTFESIGGRCAGDPHGRRLV